MDGKLSILYIVFLKYRLGQYTLYYIFQFFILYSKYVYYCPFSSLWDPFNSLYCIRLICRVSVITGRYTFNSLYCIPQKSCRDSRRAASLSFQFFILYSSHTRTVEPGFKLRATFNSLYCIQSLLCRRATGFS